MAVTQPRYHGDVHYALNMYKVLCRIMGIWPLDHHGVLITCQVVSIILMHVSLSIFIQNTISFLRKMNAKLSKFACRVNILSYYFDVVSNFIALYI